MPKKYSDSLDAVTSQAATRVDGKIPPDVLMDISNKTPKGLNFFLRLKRPKLLHVMEVKPFLLSESHPPEGLMRTMSPKWRQSVSYMYSLGHWGIRVICLWWWSGDYGMSSHSVFLLTMETRSHRWIPAVYTDSKRNVSGNHLSPLIL